MVSNCSRYRAFAIWGFEVKASGTVKHALDILYDKANKAMRPLLCAISRFNIPVKTSIHLFRTLISPIILYNAENWVTLSEKKLLTLTLDTALDGSIDAKVDNLHKKILKYILGVNKSSPTLAVMGDTGETPLLIKAYKRMVNFWHRLRTLPDDTLAKKALLENTHMRTNWIRTLEKLLNIFQIRYSDSKAKFKADNSLTCHEKYQNYWNESLINSEAPRLSFYRRLKDSFSYEPYLDIDNFYWRKAIAKLRCSSHILQIEKGRHINQVREERICKLCQLNEVENEDHLLLRCTTYDALRTRFKLDRYEDSSIHFSSTPPNTMGIFLTEAFTIRKEAIVNLM